MLFLRKLTILSPIVSHRSNLIESMWFVKLTQKQFFLIKAQDLRQVLPAKFYSDIMIATGSGLVRIGVVQSFL